MKVVLLAPTPPPAGGIAGWTVRMMNASLKNGWKVKVVDEKVIGNRQVFGEKNKRNLFLEIRRSFSIWKRLLNDLSEKDVKVVHSCIPATSTGMLRECVCALITKMKKRKFIIHYRCTLPNMVKSKSSLIIFKLLTKLSDLAIVLNTPSKEFIKGKSKTKAIVIPNFVEASALRKSTKVIKENIETILYVGGVIESKGCNDILEVAKKYPNIQFRFIGNADKKIKEMNKSSNVILLGEKNKDEVKREMESADVFMFVTYFPGEGFSNALVEAMAQGIPCIVSDWAANRDMIENKGGIVVTIKDIHAMISAIDTLIKNKGLRETQSKWNIEKVKNNYVDDIVTAIYVDEYEKLVEKRIKHVEKIGMGV